MEKTLFDFTPVKQKKFFISRGYPEESIFFCYDKPYMTEEVTKEDAKKYFCALKLTREEVKKIFERAEKEGSAIYKTYTQEEYLF